MDRAAAWDDRKKVKKLNSVTTHSISFDVRNPFRLDFTWSEKDKKNGDSQLIKSCVHCAQSLELIKVPIKVEIDGDITQNGQLMNLAIEKPIQVTYKVSNLCDDHIFECASFLDVQSKLFYASGDVRATFDIMPLDTVLLQFNLLPLQLGLHPLPRLHILDRSINPKALTLQPKALSEPDIEARIARQKDGSQAGFLVRAFTKKVLV